MTTFSPWLALVMYLVAAVLMSALQAWATRYRYPSLSFRESFLLGLPIWIPGMVVLWLFVMWVETFA